MSPVEIEQASVTDFDWAALVLFDVIEEGPERHHESLRRLDCSINTHRPDGVWSGTSAAEKRQCLGITFLGESLTYAFVQHHYGTRRYSARVAVAPFHPRCVLDAQESLRTGAATDEIAAIRALLLPAETAPRNPHLVARAKGTFIVFRSRVAVEELVEHWKHLLGIANVAAIPALFDGAVVLPGLVGMSIEPNFALVYSVPSDGQQLTDNGVWLPRAIFGLLAQLARVHVLAAHAADISSLPFSSEVPSKYLQRYTRRTHDLLGAYLRKHLSDRERAVDAIQEAEEVLRTICREGDGAASKDSWRTLFPQRLHPHAYLISGNFTTAFHENAEMLRTAISLATRRMETTTEHLRDLISVQVAVSNLRLQNTLFWIAAGALLISLVGLVVGMLPEELKQMLWAVITGVAPQESP